ncbi:MAG: nucleoid-associated protein, YbaB/EbfC family [Ignavibacteria bacterium RIFCSPLOWO2_12_FULL_56_21]|nr:MAG: nucleoid-associated protein, YbaB/EbfC family [Ignavibacteria bacterium RIFCSPLOWO2_12_FULL_56_21]
MFKGGMPNMQQMMKQMQKMQEAMAKVQADLEQRLVNGDSGGGMVRAVVNGKQKLMKIEISREVVNPQEKEMLEDLVLTAVNQALDKSNALAQEEMKKVTGGAIPGV